MPKIPPEPAILGGVDPSTIVLTSKWYSSPGAADAGYDTEFGPWLPGDPHLVGCVNSAMYALTVTMPLPKNYQHAISIGR